MMVHLGNGNGHSLNGGSPRQRDRSSFTKATMIRKSVIPVLCCLVGFIFGIQVGSSVGNALGSNHNDPAMGASLPQQCPPCLQKKCSSLQQPNSNIPAFSNNGTTTTTTSAFPPKLLKNLVADYSLVPREEFMKRLNLGVPIDGSMKRGAEHAFVLHHSKYSKPSASSHDNREEHDDAHHQPINFDKATENCESVKVVFVDPYKRSHKFNQCLAIVPQWESSHVFKYLRLPPLEKPEDRFTSESKHVGYVDVKYPLRFAPSTQDYDGYHYSDIPSFTKHILPNLSKLGDYIQHLKTAQENLKTLLSSKNFQKDTLIVATCNKGQSELLVNFVCSANSRNLDLSQLLVFATDAYTLQLCQNLDIGFCYLDETLFGDLPETAAEYFADVTFGKMVMAKVYSVHMVMSLGYHVLFQDVDMIWYRHPLDYIRESNITQEFDMMFQDDGARSLQFAPFSPNTGSFYVQNNPLTLHVLTLWLKMGDIIIARHANQGIMSKILIEQVNLMGLRVYNPRTGVTYEDGDDDDVDFAPFVGGREYNNMPWYMTYLFGLDKDHPRHPYVFHMCWTESKLEKKRFFQQMGEWRVVENINATEGGDCSNGGRNACCLAQPHIECHYRDRPSVIPCRDSPPLREGAKSLWE